MSSMPLDVLGGFVLCATSGAALVFLLWKRPKEFIGMRNGHPTYGVTLHWIAGAAVAMVLGYLHAFFCSHDQTYSAWLQGTPAKKIGTFLFVTVGGLLLKMQFATRFMKITCACAGSA